MNIFFWILQILLALHTLIGAVWKFSNSEQAVPSLAMIPHAGWIALGIVELFFCAGLILPAFKKRLAVLVPLATMGIAAEMILFCGLHLGSGSEDRGPLMYWLIVAAVCAFIAIGRRHVRI